MSTKAQSLSLDLKLIKYLRSLIIAVLTVPTILDFLFPGSSISRYSRILIFAFVASLLLINHSTLLTSKIVGAETILIILSIYVIGTFSALRYGGSITPNIALLVIFLFLCAANAEIKPIVLYSFAFSTQILIVFSTMVIFLKFNPTGYYASAYGYPVFFDFIGIPGRNTGVFSHPNTLGQAACLSILFIICSKTHNLFLVFPFLCMIKCGSRTSILSLSAGLIVFSLLTLFKERKIAIKSFNKEAPLVIGTLIVGIFFASSLQFVSNIQFLNPNSLTFRGQIWQTSSILFSDSTTFGLGWDWESRAIASNLLNIWAVSAHNVLLEVLFSSGLVGLVLFLLLIAKGIVYFYNLEKVEKAILSSFIFSGVSESIINFQYPSLTTYMFSFIILGANKMKSQN